MDITNQTLNFSFLPAWTSANIQNIEIIQYFSQMIAEKKTKKNSCKLISHFCYCVHSWTPAKTHKIRKQYWAILRNIVDKLTIRKPKTWTLRIILMPELQRRFWTLSRWYINFSFLYVHLQAKKTWFIQEIFWLHCTKFKFSIYWRNP